MLWMHTKQLPVRTKIQYTEHNNWIKKVILVGDKHQQKSHSTRKFIICLCKFSFVSISSFRIISNCMVSSSLFFCDQKRVPSETSAEDRSSSLEIKAINCAEEKSHKGKRNEWKSCKNAQVGTLEAYTLPHGTTLAGWYSTEWLREYVEFLLWAAVLWEHQWTASFEAS